MRFPTTLPQSALVPTLGPEFVNKTYVDRIGATQSNNANTLLTGALGADLIATSCPITITAGTWMVQASVCVFNTTTQDSALCYIWNGTTASAVANSRGACGVSLTTAYAQLVSNLTVLTVAVSTTLYPAATRNGVSTLQFPTSNNCGGPNAVITAVRIA